MKNLISLILSSSLIFGQNWLQQRIVADQFDKALSHYDEGRFATAEKILNKVLEKETGEYELPVHLLAMKTNYALGDLDGAKALGKKLFTQYAQHDYLPETFMVLGDVFVSEGDNDAAFRMYMRSRQMDNEESFVSKVDDRVQKIIQQQISLQTIEELKLTAYGSNEIILLLAESVNHLSNGDPDECAFSLSQFDPDHIPSTYFDLYENLLLASYEPAMESFMFGVILPLTGEDSESGRSFLKGLYQFTQSPGQQVNIAFQVEDTKSDPLETIKAIDRLSRNNQLLGVIAALDDSESLSVINRMKNTNTPLIVPGGNAIRLTEAGDNVFQLRSDWSTQGRLAAKWIAEYLEKDSIAILSPMDDFGHVVTDAFLRELDAQDKTVVVVERYSGKPENVKMQFQRMRKVAFDLIPPENPYDEFLGMSFDSLDALFDVNTDDLFELAVDEEEVKIKDSSKVVLETIQALYVPIHDDHLKYIGTQLPMYNLNTRLVGNISWDQPEIIIQDNVGPHLEGMTIISHKNVDHRSDSPDQLENNDFLLGYDVSGLLSTIVMSGIQNRIDFKEKLEQSHYQGMAHTFVFLPEDHSNSTMQILQCTDRKFSPIGSFMADTVQFHISQRP